MYTDFILKFFFEISAWCPVLWFICLFLSRSSQTSSEDLSAFLDNLIPFRENLFILVETNAPVTRPASTKEKRRKSIKDRISMENLKVSPVSLVSKCLNRFGWCKHVCF